MSDQLITETSTLKHNIHNRWTSTPPVGSEPAISAGERPQNYALDHMAAGTGSHVITCAHMDKAIPVGIPKSYEHTYK